MKKINMQKIFLYSVFLIVLVMYGPVYAEPPDTDKLPDAEKLSGTDKLPDTDKLLEEVTSEQNDPFEVVTPIDSDKSNLMSKLFGAEGEGGIGRVAAEKAPERFMESVMLKFLRAENVAAVVGNLLTDSGAISIDNATNTIIICDTQENLDKMIREIRKADQTPKQVLIEVVIMDVQLSDDTEIGVNWDDLSIGHTAGYEQTLSDLGTSGGTFTLIQNGISTAVKALQQVRDTEILATPRLLVVSGQTAYLETIEEIPYSELTQTDSGGGGDSAISSTEFKDAGITLTVSPIITDEGRILIAIEPDQSFNTGISGVGSTTVPIVDRRRVSTKLLMDDGQVLVIGGLRRKDVRINRDKIPLLGDLPLIGGLFSNDKKVIEHSELLIMVSPHIYDGLIPLKEDEAARWQEARSLKPVRLAEKIRPEYKAIEETLPEIKAQVR